MIYPIVSVLIISAVSFIGVLTLSLNPTIVKKSIFLFVSLAVGAMLGDAFLHLIPEAIESSGQTVTISLFVIFGVFIFFIIEQYLHWHHHEDDSEFHVHPVGKMILFSDGLHNFLDGIIIAVSYTISIEIGIATTIAVILHEIPQEFGDFGVLLHSGYKPSRALFLNFISALMSVVGVIFVIFFGDSINNFMPYIIAIASGGFIYIAVVDLIPELHKSNNEKSRGVSIAQITMALIGVLIMYALLFLE